VDSFPVDIERCCSDQESRGRGYQRLARWRLKRESDLVPVPKVT